MPNDAAMLLDIATACRRCMSHVSGVDRAAFGRDTLRQDGTVRQLEIIGEAVKRLSDEFRARYQEIPWKQIAGMRDRLIHEYDDVDIDEVWRTVTQDVPALLKWMEPHLKSGE